MKFTVEFKPDEYRNLEKVEFTIGEDISLDELMTEVIRPILTSIGYAEELINSIINNE